MGTALNFNKKLRAVPNCEIVGYHFFLGINRLIYFLYRRDSLKIPKLKINLFKSILTNLGIILYV